MAYAGGTSKRCDVRLTRHKTIAISPASHCGVTRVSRCTLSGSVSLLVQVSGRICAPDQYIASGGMKKSAWAPAPNLQVSVIARNDADWTISVNGRDHGLCPGRGIRSLSRHSSYLRTLRDLPAQGTPVSVQARLTRWRCRNDLCERRMFTERLPGLAAPFARRTARLSSIVRLFGHTPCSASRELRVRI
jgi:hypothetical protein